MPNKIEPCPKCKETPTIGYACGEYFVWTESAPIGTCICSSFHEMHASEGREIEAWNEHVKNHRFCENCYHYNKDKPYMCAAEACKDGDEWKGA